MFLSIEQIIPLKDAEDYIIKIAERAQDDIITESRLKSSDVSRQEFGTILLREMAQKVRCLGTLAPEKKTE